jgi:hypothetical protein
MKFFYVGQGINPRPFVDSSRTPRWRNFVATHGIYCVEVHFWTGDRKEAQDIEHELIVDFEPVCNVRPKDNRSKFPPVILRKITTLRLDPAVVAKLDKAAKADNRSRSSLLQKIIAEWVKGAK